ncbi:MAG: phosphomannomutase [Gammaproteobacteria bacterium]|nr:phosphomannomutase [Gammaproteobacteria bacterium]
MGVADLPADPRKACFKAYDIRGRVPDELDPGLAARIGRAFAEQFKLQRVVMGRDVRLSGPELARALASGLAAAGARVLDMGLCGTEELYFAVNHLECDGGVMVTASHNPSDYNGFKLVRQGARPVSADTGLQEIAQRALAERRASTPAAAPEVVQARDAYVLHVLKLLRTRLPAFRLVVNPGNGAAGPLLEKLCARLPFSVTWMNREPDGHFPNGVPNPLLPENREATARRVREYGADLGLAWDGDFDRCFFFDERGEFIEGYYLVGLLAEYFLRRFPGARIIHDPRLVWNTRDIVERLGGVAIESKCGHAFIKERMRSEDAVYGGEMSAHHYFRDFFYCDSGMIPWLLVLELMAESQQPLSALLAERMRRFPVSGEINRAVRDSNAAMKRVENHYAGQGSVSRVDGLSMDFGAWRFNLRPSNTEALLRLNVESRGDAALVQACTREILGLIDTASPQEAGA